MEQDILDMINFVFLSLALVMTSASLIVSLASALPFDHWMFRVWEFPRVQIVVLCILNLAIFLFAKAEYFEDFTLLCILINALIILFQAHWILPYTPFFRKEIKSVNKPRTDEQADNQVCLKVMTSNVLMTNRQAGRLIDLVKEHSPDILVTLESDVWWQQQLDDALPDYPHRVAAPQDNLYGMHVYSKFKLSMVEIRYAVKKDIPSITCKATLDNGALVHFFFIHPEPPSPTEADTAKPRDKELLIYAKQAQLSSRPVIVTGDLNDVAWSPTTKAFRQRSKLLDPRIGRGFFNTFHAWHWWARWPLDHIFVSDHFQLKSICRLKDIGSDHFPLMTELCLNKAPNTHSQTQ